MFNNLDYTRFVTVGAFIAFIHVQETIVHVNISESAIPQ